MDRKKLQEDLYKTSWRTHQAEAGLAYAVAVFGDELARREGYKDIDGLEAVHLYLIRKHHWLPRDVQSMSAKDLRLALHVEMQGWTLPPEAQPARD